MHRHKLLNLLKIYQTSFMDEAGYLRRAIDYVTRHEDCFYRDMLPAHVTASAWIVNPDRNRVLLLHHKKLGRWFQPGGHADGESNVLAVALKEALEETGLSDKFIRLLDSNIFDIDIHNIPALGKDPAHEHIDVRFLFEVDDRICVPGNEESHHIMWVPLHQVSRFNNNRSSYRMVEKTRRMRDTNIDRYAG